MEEVLIEIPLKGEVKIETRGFKGKACKAATESLEKALGGDITSDTWTAEAHISERTTVGG